MNTYTLKSVAIAAVFAVFMVNSARATNYTAVASGNFSSPATWSGGIIPSSVLLGDAVIVPPGINVTLDQNLQMNGLLSSIILDGTMGSSVSAVNSLTLTSGSITGAGSLNVDSVVLAQPYGFDFTGAVHTKKMVSLGSAISASAAITVSTVLELRNAVLALNGGSLTLGTGATILVTGGKITRAGGGTLSLANDYNVIYRGNSATTGIELMGSGLTNVQIDVPTVVSLGNNLSLKGTLQLTSGTLNTNNRDLFFTGNANASADGSGTISSTNGTNISFTSATNFTGGLRFSNTGNTVNDLTINLGNNTSAVKVSSDLQVDGTLTLQSGRIDIDGNDLVVNGNMTGGSASSFVITGENGRLVTSLAAGGFNTYYIGTSANYAPAIVEGNQAAATAMVGVGVNTSVFSEGSVGSGVDLSQSQALVNATWFVTSSATTNIDLNLQTMWSANMEVNGFDRTQLYLSHYTNANWDVSAATTANTEANGMYSAKLYGITSLSPFAVMGKNAVTTAIANIPSTNTGVLVYPNPAINTLNIPGNFTKASVYNLNGAIVKTADIYNNAISVGELPAGLYTVLLMGDDTRATAQFYKQ